MAELDYAKLGLKCGLEIHQQLDTKKLFCNCPSVLRQEEPDFEIKRGLTTAQVAIERLVLKLSFTQAKASSSR